MTTQIIRAIPEYLELRKSFQNKTIGFVPTMGALHSGHAELLKKAREENDIVVCSIFVNPTQFNNAEDLDKYPRTLEKDLSLISSTGTDYLFYPQFNDMYPDQYLYKIEEKEFSKRFCGLHRPGHFDGVLTVVMKLFNIITPTKAYFGEKDYQQLSLIEGMVKAFFMNLEIVPVPTIRDEHGLALSSRNTRLSSQGLKKAQTFAKILNQPHKSIADIKNDLAQENIEVEYIESYGSRRLAAVWIEGVRLIDNV